MTKHMEDVSISLRKNLKGGLHICSMSDALDLTVPPNNPSMLCDLDGEMAN